MVPAKDHANLWREHREAVNRFLIGGRIGAGAYEVNGARVIGVAGEEKSVGEIEETEGIRGVARHGEDADGSSSEVNDVAVVKPLGGLPGTGGVGGGVEVFGEGSADFLRFDLGADFSRAERVLPGVIAVEVIDRGELPIASGMVRMSVGVNDDDVQRGEPSDEAPEVADAHAGVKEECAALALDEVNDGFFLLVRLVDCENSGSDAIDLEPGIIDGNTLKRLVVGTRQSAAPVRGHESWASRHGGGLGLARDYGH